MPYNRRLTNDHVHPFVLAQERPVLDDVFECRKHHLERTRPQVSLNSLASDGRAFVHDGRYSRSPFLELESPIGEGGERYDDKEWTGLVLAFDKEGDQGDGLNGLAETLREEGSLLNMDILDTEERARLPSRLQECRSSGCYTAIPSTASPSADSPLECLRPAETAE